MSLLETNFFDECNGSDQDLLDNTYYKLVQELCKFYGYLCLLVKCATAGADPGIFKEEGLLLK